jgi:2-methylcitrate dehydratase PrpD
LLAEKGFTASTQALEAKRGFCSVLAGEYDLAKATAGLGQEYLLMRNGLKPYACGVVTHPTIDGVRALRQKHGLKAGDVAEIETKVHPLVLELTGKQQPKTGLEGKFSIYFCAAIALIEGSGGYSQFTDENVNRADVVALRDRVRAEVTPGIKESQAVVTIRTTDGRELVERVEAASGTPANPLSDADLEQKFMDLVLPVLPRAKAEQIVDLVGRIDKLDNLSQLIALATP